MPRIKLPLPSRIDFEMHLTLRVGDMNYGGHMGNDSVLTIAHEARVQFLQSLALEERNFYGVSLLMADSAVVYKKEAFYGDNLIIQISVSELYNYGFELLYLIKDVNSNLEVARVKTGLVCYSHKDKKITTLPMDFYNKFS
ncbi:MAG: thioesterase [Flavobacteriales bacterium]|nr:thioesterase [Flavobacteriales bacterium]|tara:strand:- start:427 stop:849 length:423 start_codon:yes stop_codon:yes gene_type:complete